MNPRDEALPGPAIHEVLARLRSERRLSVAQLAQRAGLSPNAVRWIERGMTQPKPETLKALATALDVRYEVLLQRAGYIDEPSVSSAEQEVLTLFNALPSERQALALDLLRALGGPSDPPASSHG